MAQASFGACFYLAKTAWPFGVTAFYPRPEARRFPDAALRGVPLPGSCWPCRRRSGSGGDGPGCSAALAAYLVIASPYLGLVRVGITLAADRYSYAPMMAWVVLGCAGLCTMRNADGRVRVLVRGRGRYARRRLRPDGALLGPMPRLGQQRAPLESRRWSTPDGARSCIITWARRLPGPGELERAIAEFREALRLRPHYFEATYDLGVALDRLGETDAAIEHFREARRLRPDDAKVHLSLGGALVHRGHVDEAVALYREALQAPAGLPQSPLQSGRRPASSNGRLTRRSSELNQGRGAAALVRRGVRRPRWGIRPPGPAGRSRRPVPQGLRLDPDHSASRINLGLALARQRDVRRGDNPIA